MIDSLREARMFSWNEPISVQRSTVSNTSFHQHTFLELSYITKGSAVHLFQNRSVIVREGDYFAVNYREAHKFSPNGQDCFEVINVLFKPEFVDPTLKGCRGFEDLVMVTGINCNYYHLQEQPTGVTYHDTDGSIRTIFEKMHRESAEQPPKYRELLRCYLTELIIVTLRKIYRDDAMDCSNAKLSEILTRIQEDYASDLRLKDLAAQIGYTDSYLSTIFTQKVGISFSKYLQNVRIAKACEMLCSTDKNIDEISEACGYNDIKTFRELFRSRMKMSPSEFRSESRREAPL